MMYHIKAISYKYILTCFILFSILLLTGCGKSVLDQTSSPINRNLPDEKSSNVVIYSYNEDKVDYILTAAKIEKFYNLKRLYAYDVKIVTYDLDMKIKSEIVADTAFVDEARNFIQAIGNVVFNTPNGIIKSRVVNWERNYDEIYVPEKVTLIRDDDVLYGDNLRTDSNISFIEMNTVSAEGTVKGDELDW